MTAAPASRQSLRFSSEIAFCAELFGKLIPNASMAEAIVFAVYIPPHEPGPGIAVCSTSRSSCSDTVPPATPPTASNTEIISRRFFPG